MLGGCQLARSTGDPVVWHDEFAIGWNEIFDAEPSAVVPGSGRSLPAMTSSTIDVKSCAGGASSSSSAGPDAALHSARGGGAAEPSQQASTRGLRRPPVATERH